MTWAARTSGRRRARCQGSPIFTTFFASAERATAHPSLFDSTTTARPRSRGEKARSHEQ